MHISLIKCEDVKWATNGNRIYIIYVRRCVIDAISVCAVRAQSNVCVFSSAAVRCGHSALRRTSNITRWMAIRMPLRQFYKYDNDSSVVEQLHTFCATAKDKCLNLDFLTPFTHRWRTTTITNEKFTSMKFTSALNCCIEKEIPNYRNREWDDKIDVITMGQCTYTMRQSFSNWILSIYILFSGLFWLIA